MCNVTRLVLLHAGQEAGAADGTYAPTALARKVVRGHALTPYRFPISSS